MELLLSLASGIFVGMLAGILPGLGITSSLILSYPFIKHLDPISIICFYIAIACSVQYFGSVVGIYLGVPGETTALVSSQSGYNLMMKGKGNASLGSTAIASLFASLVAAVILYFTIPNTLYLMPVFSVKVQSLIFLSIAVILIFYGSNSKFTNTSFVLIGLLLSTIGYNPVGISITFNNDMFIPGLNSGIVLLMIFVIPNLLRFWNQKIYASSTKIDLQPTESIGWVIKKKFSVLRGTIIGVTVGLIPGVGPIISSNVAAQVEQKFSKSQSAKLLSAEAANNSAIIACLIPFFSLGLTFMAHEAVINDLLTYKNVLVNSNWLLESTGNWSKLDIVVLLIIAVNIISFIIAWPACRSLILIYKFISYKKIVVSIIVTVTSLLLYESYHNFRFDLDLLSFIMFAPLTYFLIKRKLDPLPIMFSYLIGDSLIKSLFILKNIL